VIAAGTAWFRFDDLVGLVALLDDLGRNDDMGGTDDV
jgi:hypothetical protein